jgi:transposase InsO family protein
MWTALWVIFLKILATLTTAASNRGRPLSDTDIDLYCKKHRLSEPARTIIERARSGNPLERPPGGSGKHRYTYPSRKMGHSVEVTSVEYPVLHTLEHDPSVLEFWDRATEVKHSYFAQNKKTGHWYPSGERVVPFLFVLRADEAGWEEWWTEKQLEQKAEQFQGRYEKDADGCWRCPSGEQYAAQFGFYYRVRCVDEIDATLRRNYEFLADFLFDACTPAPERESEILKIVGEEPGIFLSDLLESVEHATSDDIYGLIATKRLYVNLYSAPLSEPDLVRCFLDEHSAQSFIIVADELRDTNAIRPKSFMITEGAQISWDGKLWNILNVGQQKITLAAADGAKMFPLAHAAFDELLQRGEITGLPQDEAATDFNEGSAILAQASLADQAEANRRYGIIKWELEDHPLSSGGFEPSAEEMQAWKNTPPRTRRDWKRNYRQAKEKYGSGYIGLLPRTSRKGNRKARIVCEEALDILETHIKKYLVPVRPRKAKIYRDYKKACEEKGLLPVSRTTFSNWIANSPQYAQELSRKGKKAAEIYKTPYWYLKPDVPPHGEYPMHRCYIDHTQLDVMLRCSRTGRILGRPWVTFLTCGLTRRILAVYISFNEPGAISCLMVLRECFRRHNRLPSIIIVDWGPEFKSKEFDTLLALFEVTKIERPPSESRYGYAIEYIFDMTNDHFIHNLQGNTQATRDVRQITAETNPENLAVWTLGILAIYLTRYTYDVYDTCFHGLLGLSPRDAFERGIARSGARLHRWKRWNGDDVRMQFLPTTDKGTAKVQPGKGIKIKRIYYWCSEFDLPDVMQTSVPVRFDPFDRSIAYAFIKSRHAQGNDSNQSSEQSIPHGHWVQCRSKYMHQFKGRSDRQIEALSEELRQLQALRGTDEEINDRKLAEFSRQIDLEEGRLAERLKTIRQKMLEPRLKDLENLDARTILEGGTLDREPFSIPEEEDESAPVPTDSTDSAEDKKKRKGQDAHKYGLL